MGPNRPIGSYRNASLSPDLSAFIVGFWLGFRLMLIIYVSVKPRKLFHMFTSVLFMGGRGVKLAQTQLTDFSNLPLRLFSVFIKPHQ